MLGPATERNHDSLITPAPTEVERRDALYHEIQPFVRSLIRRYGATLNSGDDLSGEIYTCFCALYTAYDPNRGIPIRAYLARMLPQAVFNQLRKHWRRQHREVELWPAGVEEMASYREEGQDPTGNWDQAIWLEQAVAALPLAIAGLPARQQQIVIWRYYDGRSFEEMAELLHVRPATVRSLLRHAIHTLQHQLGPKGAP